MKRTIFLGFLILMLTFIAIDNGIKKVYYKKLAIESITQTRVALGIIQRYEKVINGFYKNPPPETQETQDKKKTFAI